MDLRSMELAHDLKMPLQMIYSCIQLLEMEIKSDARAQEYISMMMQSAKQMQDMVSGMLNDCAAHPREMDVVQTVREICNRCALFAGEQSVKIDFLSNADHLRAMSDPEMLTRILQNLLSNAMRYAPRGSHVRVEIAALGDFWRLSVADEGSGISKEILPHLFDVGVSEGGTGCGLAIVRKYVSALRGTIEVNSTKMGTCFHVRLPIA